MNYLLMDLERTILSGVPCYWKANKRGYSFKLSEAGFYQKEVAETIVNEDLDKNTIMISIEYIENLLFISLDQKKEIQESWGMLQK